MFFVLKWQASSGKALLEIPEIGPGVIHELVCVGQSCPVVYLVILSYFVVDLHQGTCKLVIMCL